MARIPQTLPIYVFCGSADPVGDMGESPTALVTAYRSLRVRDLEFVLYPDARHELLNETNREEVMGNILRWLTRRLAEQP
jgi:alpha-beta hydrolase superfamily lysophospholipase